MDRESVREFATRNREEPGRLKLRHWAERYRCAGPSATVAAGHALYLHARRVRSDFPSAAERSKDLAHHVELTRLLDRIADGLADR